MRKIFGLAFAAAALFAASPAAALAPPSTTIRGILNGSSGNFDDITWGGGSGRYINFDFSKPVRLDGQYFYFADFGASYCDAAHTMECMNNYSDDHGTEYFGGYGTRFSVDTYDTVFNGFVLGTYLVDGRWVKSDFSAQYFNTNVVPVSYSITFSQGVPEPASWLMMIVGVGFVGAAARTRRQLVANS